MDYDALTWKEYGLTCPCCKDVARALVPLEWRTESRKVKGGALYVYRYQGLYYGYSIDLTEKLQLNSNTFFCKCRHKRCLQRRNIAAYKSSISNVFGIQTSTNPIVENKTAASFLSMRVPG